jgi:putative DNA primase/helicase
MIDAKDVTTAANPNQGNQHELRNGHLGDPAQGGGPEEPGQGSCPPPAVESADSPKIAAAILSGLREDPMSPDGLAASFVQGATWIYWGDIFLRFTGTHYVPATESELRADIHKHLRRRFLEQWEADREANVAQKSTSYYHVTPDKVNAVLAAVRSQQMLPSVVSMPSHLKDTKLDELITLQNGLLDLKTGQLLPHTLDYFDMVLLPYKYDPEATCPFFMANLHRMFADKPDVIPFLQEYFGWVLSPNSDAQIFLYLHGTGSTGKTSLLASLEALIGPQNTAHQCLAELAGEFGMHPLMGKKLNVCSDMDALDARAEGILKRLVDGGTVSMNRKYKDIMNVQLNTRFAFASNKIPRFDDQSTGIYRRFVPIAVETVIDPSNIIRGLDKPAGWMAMGELSGILNWALEGLKRLRAHRWSFEIPEVIKKHRQEIRAETDFAHDYLTKRYTYTPGGSGKVGSSWLYDQYQSLAKIEGHTPDNVRKFNDSVRSTFPGIKKDSARINGSVMQVWFGLEKAK